jgi:hypothetical protein
LLRAHAVNQPLLPRPQDLRRQGLKVAENPQQVYTLPQRGLDVAWSQRRQHAQYAAGQFLNPHGRTYLVLSFSLALNQSNSRASIIAPILMHVQKKFAALYFLPTGTIGGPRLH